VILRLTPFLFAASSAFGAEQTFSSNGGVLILRTILSLAVVIALVWGSLWFLKRVMSGRKSDSGAIRVSGMAHLGPKQRIVLIDVEERRMVLGVTEQSVTLLADLGKTPKSKTKPASIPSKTIRFADILGSIRRRGANATV
jgi:flagellar protein FliO/FliZ